MVAGEWLPDVLPFYYRERQKYSKKNLERTKVSSCNKERSSCYDEERHLEKRVAAQENLLRRLLYEHKSLTRNNDQKSATLIRLKHAVQSSEPLQKIEPPCCNVQEEAEEKVRDDTAQRLAMMYDSLMRSLGKGAPVPKTDISSVSSVIDLCPPLCEEKIDENDENLDMRSNSLYAIGDEPLDLSASIPGTEVDMPECESIHEDNDMDLAKFGDTQRDKQESYCLYRSGDEFTERNKHLKRMHNIQVALIERRKDQLAMQVCQAKQLKHALLKNVMHLRRELRKVSFQLMDMKVSSELASGVELPKKSKQCKGRTRRCHARGVSKKIKA